MLGNDKERIRGQNTTAAKVGFLCELCPLVIIEVYIYIYIYKRWWLSVVCLGSGSATNSLSQLFIGHLLPPPVLSPPSLVSP
jgi:hypothetical protein